MEYVYQYRKPDGKIVEELKYKSKRRALIKACQHLKYRIAIPVAIFEDGILIYNREKIIKEASKMEDL